MNTLSAKCTDTCVGTDGSVPPIDGDLAREDLVRAVPRFGSGKWQLLSTQTVGSWRKRHGRRVLRCGASYRDTSDNRVKSLELVVKVFYRGDRGAGSVRAYRQLWEADFRPPARFQVPRVYGYEPERGILVQAAAQGRAWFDLLQAGDRALSTASARAAGWLLRLQASAATPETRGAEADGAAVGQQIHDLASTFLPHAPRLEAIGDRLVHRLEMENIPLLPSHGDYHPKNVFLTSEVTTAIDLDLFGLREAAFDVGYAIGELLAMSHYHLGGLTPGAKAALAFWQGYQPGGQASWPRVAAQVARAFLQTMHYGLYAMHGNRPEELNLWPRLMEEWLDSDGPAILEGVVAEDKVVPLFGPHRPTKPPLPREARVRESAA